MAPTGGGAAIHVGTTFERFLSALPARDDAVARTLERGIAWFDVERARGGGLELIARSPRAREVLPQSQAGVDLLARVRNDARYPSRMHQLLLTFDEQSWRFAFDVQNQVEDGRRQLGEALARAATRSDPAADTVRGIVNPLSPARTEVSLALRRDSSRLFIGDIPADVASRLGGAKTALHEFAHTQQPLPQMPRSGAPIEAAPNADWLEVGAEVAARHDLPELAAHTGLATRDQARRFAAESLTYKTHVDGAGEQLAGTRFALDTELGFRAFEQAQFGDMSGRMGVRQLVAGAAADMRRVRNSLTASSISS